MSSAPPSPRLRTSRSRATASGRSRLATASAPSRSRRSDRLSERARMTASATATIRVSSTSDGLDGGLPGDRRRSSSAAWATVCVSSRCSAQRIRSTTAPNDWVMSSGRAPASPREQLGGDLVGQVDRVAGDRAVDQGAAGPGWRPGRSVEQRLLLAGLGGDEGGLRCSSLMSPATRAAYATASCSAVPALARANADDGAQAVGDRRRRRRTG